jgi:hypothetical protein
MNLSDIRHKFDLKELSDMQMFDRGLSAVLEDKSGMIRVIKLVRDKFKPSKSKFSADTGKLDDQQLDILAEKIADKYLENIALVDRLAKIYGFNYKFFLQPNLYLKPPSALELGYSDLSHQDRIAIFKKAYSKILEKHPPENNFVDISGIFSNMYETIYLDLCHTSEKGNELIAKQIYDNIKTELLEK